MISIRRQLTREVLMAVLLLLAAGLGGLLWATWDYAQDHFSATQQAKARAISTLTFQEGDAVRFEFSDRFMHGFEGRAPRDFFQLWRSDGSEIARSESLVTGSELPRRFGSLDNPTQWNLKLPNGRPGRALGFSFKPKPLDPAARAAPQELQLVVASDREELDEMLWQLFGLCALLSALLAITTLWLIPRVLRRGLQPLERLGQEVTEINSSSLSTRINTAALPAEIQPIALRLNELLDRLELSFERERRFSSDLAHELRTPLAELRTAAECALKWPEARDPDIDRDALAIAQHMERLVSHLLALTRGEQKQLPVSLESVSLASAVELAWRHFADAAHARELSVELNLIPVTGLADAVLLRAIVTNLFENAVDYTPRGGTIRIGVWRWLDQIVVSVANTTDDFCEEDLPKLFDRFWRKDAARTGGQHVGLGLSLSRSFAQAMHWSLDASLDDQRRLVFKLTGPRAEQAAPKPDPITTAAV